MADQNDDKWVPTFEAPSDDLVIKDGEGNEHRPHAGEKVIFLTDMPWRLFYLDPALPALEYTATAVKIFKRQIVDWDWTNRRRKPLPRPEEDPAGFEDCLWDLSPEERAWLLNNCWKPSELPNG